VRAKPEARPYGIRRFLQTVIARAYPRLIGANREPTWLFFDVFLPLLSICAYVFVYRAIGAPEAYIGFVVMGGAMTAFWMNILWSMSTQLFWEREQGNLSLYIVAPTSLMAILLGMALGGILATTLRSLAILLLGYWVFNVQFVVSSFLALFVTFTLTMVSLYGLGMMTSSLFLLYGRAAWHLAHLAEEPVFLLSGFYFPVKSLNFWVAAVSSLIPLTLGLDAMRQLVFSSGPLLGFLPIPMELLVLVILSVAFITGAHFLLAYTERLAVREGRLTESKT